MTRILRTRPRLEIRGDLGDIVWRSIRQPEGAWKEGKLWEKDLR